jgi:hypothetical protein
MQTVYRKICFSASRPVDVDSTCVCFVQMPRNKVVLEMRIHAETYAVKEKVYTQDAR